MSYQSKFKNKDVDDLFEAILSLENEEECYRFFEDICTIKELQSIAQRLEVAKLLREKKTYSDIEEITKASTATISRINKCLMYGSDGYNLILDRLEKKFSYPMFVKPAGTGSSVGVSKASDRDALRRGLLTAGTYDAKILVEEFIHGREIEVAVMGNANPVASICGEIDSGADFYDYDAKYVTDTSTAYIPARIPEEIQEQIRKEAVKVYKAIGCHGLSRVDFFATYEGNRVVFNEINTLPGFTSISMYPKLFAASGIPYSDLIDQLRLHHAFNQLLLINGRGGHEQVFLAVGHIAHFHDGHRHGTPVDAAHGIRFPYIQALGTCFCYHLIQYQLDTHLHWYFFLI